MKSFLIKVNCILSILVFISEVCIASERLCPIQVDDSDEMKMQEVEFTYEHFLDSIKFFEEGLLGLSEDMKVIPLIGVEQYTISYPNSLRIIKGYALKKEALFLRSQVEIEMLKAADKKPEQQRLKNLKQKYFKAKNTFCKNLAESIFVD